MLVARRTDAPRSKRRSRSPSTDPSAEEFVIADVSVREALGSLSDDDREILLLNAWDGLDTHALGVYFVISTNAAAVRLSRAQARFRELLECGGGPLKC